MNSEFEKWLSAVSSKSGGASAVENISSGAWRILLDELVSDLRKLGKDFPEEMECIYPVFSSFWNHIIAPKTSVFVRADDVRISYMPSEFTQLVVALVLQLREALEKLKTVGGSVHAADNNSTGGEENVKHSGEIPEKVS